MTEISRSTNSGVNVNDVVCPKCQKTLKRKYFRKYHAKTCQAESDLQYKCHVCGKSGFVNYVTLRNHVRSLHSSDRPFQCQHCSQKFSRSESLSKHMIIRHGVNKAGKLVERKRFSCHTCGKILSSKTNLDSHVTVVHRGVRKFTCKVCDKKFSSKHNLNNHHTSVHSIERTEGEKESPEEVQYVTHLEEVYEIFVKN